MTDSAVQAKRWKPLNDSPLERERWSNIPGVNVVESSMSETRDALTRGAAEVHSHAARLGGAESARDRTTDDDQAIRAVSRRAGDGFVGTPEDG